MLVKVITFDVNFMALAYVKRTNLTWPLLEDPERKLYEAYSMTRGSLWSVFGFPSIWKYIKLIFRGSKPGKPGKDWLQLGGDILIDPEGIVRIAHVSTNPHDRPSVDSLFATFEKDLTQEHA